MPIRRLIALVALLLPAALVSAGAVAPAEARTPADRYERAAVKATNAQRVDRDRVRLRQHACLQRFADRWAKRMARRGDLVHQSLQPIARQCQLRMAGENIAYGFRTGRAVVNRGWMRSTGHRQNILRPQYRLIAVGAHRDGRGVWWTSQLFGRR